MRIRRTLASLSIAALVTTGLAACSSDSKDSASGADNKGPIKIGTTDSNLEEWSVFEDLAKKAGYDIDIQNFSDYNTPNQALAQGQLDTNKFQHLKFLAEYNVGNDTDLVPLASTEIYPLALFWKGHDSIDGIAGQEVVIPNDSTNQGRAINLLAANNLVKLKKDSLTPTPADIDQSASKVKVTPVDAAQTPTGFNEGKPAIINNNFLGNAGIKPSDAVLQDDPKTKEAEPYINVWAVRKEDVDNKTLNELAKLWKDPAVTKAIEKSSNGTAVPVDRPRAELQQILDRLEKEIS